MHKSQSLFNLTTALHVSGVTITHFQKHKTTATTASGNRHTVLLSAAIVEELEPVWVCCGWRIRHYKSISLYGHVLIIIKLKMYASSSVLRKKKIGSLAQVQYRRSSSISFKVPLRAPRDYFDVKRIGITEGQTSSLKIHNWYVPPSPVHIRSKCDLGNHSSNGWCCVEGGQRGPPGSSCALIN